jgi:hypothetical protein
MSDSVPTNDPSTDSSPINLAPVEIELTVNGQQHRLSYEKAFSLACNLLESDRIDDASKLFRRLEEFTDRGPRAFMMHAF